MAEKSELILNALISSKPLDVVIKYLKNKDLVGISLLFDKQFYDMLRGKLLNFFMNYRVLVLHLLKYLKKFQLVVKKEKVGKMSLQIHMI
jgi:hypothetical protein